MMSFPSPARASATCALLALFALSACRSGPEHVLSEFACHAGAWQDARGEVFVLTSTTTGAMRYRLADGRSGLFRPDGPGADTAAPEGWRQDGPVAARAVFGTCSDGNVAFAIGDETPLAARRLALVAEDVRFDSDGLSLRGRLVLPAQADGPVPLAVLVHGSEDYSALDTNPLQYLLPAQGVAVFVYDKRGTGGSEGRYTQDFDALAGDAIAALDTARRMRPDAFAHAGYVGGSQGGWVAPLAASRSRADYAVALFGLAESPLAEDREQVANDLRAKGHGEDIVARSREVTDATAMLMASGFTRGFDELAAVRAKYGHEPWFADVRGEFSGQVLGIPDWAPQWIVRRIAARHDRGTTWEYEPLPVLERLDAPQLWVVAAEDLEAPPAETLRRIRMLQANGRPIDLAVFPDTDHGMLEYVEGDGARTFLRHPEGYFTLLGDWIAQRPLQARYGTAELERPAARTPPLEPQPE
jgi:uncharacterized protein